jgi:hypothetical protein
MPDGATRTGRQLTCENTIHMNFLYQTYKSLPKDEIPQLKKPDKKKVSLFGATYKCQQLLSRLRFSEYKTSTLTDRYALSK